LARVSGGVVLAGGAVALVTGCAPVAPAPSGLADCDSGPSSDEAGHGRTGGRTGMSDQDSGMAADQSGCGRGSAGATVTDNDRGRLADPRGRGRGPAGRYSDNDIGLEADPIGRGRRGPPAAPGNRQ